jgi:hypothetical protein
MAPAARSRICYQLRCWRFCVAACCPEFTPADIRYREDIVDGIEKAPEAFIGMLAGRNFGKALVRLS